jgi:hypothetical protein
MRYEIKTVISPKEINQSLFFHNTVSGSIIEHFDRVLRLHDHEIVKALKKSGWLSPEEADKMKCCENCKHSGKDDAGIWCRKGEGLSCAFEDYGKWELKE